MSVIDPNEWLGMEPVKRPRVPEPAFHEVTDRAYLEYVYAKLCSIVQICSSDINPYDGKGNVYCDMSPTILLPIINGIHKHLRKE